MMFFNQLTSGELRRSAKSLIPQAIIAVVIGAFVAIAGFGSASAAPKVFTLGNVDDGAIITDIGYDVDEDDNDNDDKRRGKKNYGDNDNDDDKNYGKKRHGKKRYGEKAENDDDGDDGYRNKRHGKKRWGKKHDGKKRWGKKRDGKKRWGKKHHKRWGKKHHRKWEKNPPKEETPPAERTETEDRDNTVPNYCRCFNLRTAQMNAADLPKSCKWLLDANKMQTRAGICSVRRRLD